MSGRFTVDLGWGSVLSSLGIAPGDLLRMARLPGDLFVRERPQLEPDAFLRLWHVLEAEVGAEAGLKIGTTIDTMAFSPPLFAAFCSPDLRVAVRRLAQYKPLIGPLRLEFAEAEGRMTVAFGALGGLELPQEYIAAELVFLVHLARTATRTRIEPKHVEMRQPVEGAGYAAFFGRPVRQGQANRLILAEEAVSRPFHSANPALFAAFAPELRKRLDALVVGSSMSDRVRAVLLEALPAARTDIGPVARMLGVSARSLQRKLAEEGTSFRAELTTLREQLARDYLARTRYTSAEIAYLLGYADPNSFIRAFHSWTGTTPEALRKHA